MKIDKLKEIFGSQLVDEIANVNPLALAERREFNRPLLRRSDYREAAIKFVGKEGLPFTSTHNSVFTFLKDFVTVHCPYCVDRIQMTYADAGGAGSTFHAHYRCKKGHHVNLSVPVDFFSAEAKRE